MKTQRQYYYDQLINRMEYNPRLFLILLIWGGVAIFAYQFALSLTSQWMMAALASLGILGGAAILVWPFHAAVLFPGISFWIPTFVRGGTMMGLASALVYPGDLFIVSFLILEFFRGCMRQTHLYTSTDRWVLAYYIWVLFSVIRGGLVFGYSAVGEAREHLYAIAYFMAIHYVNRPDQTKTVLKMLGWTCVVTALLQVYWFAIAGNFLPRYPGGGGGIPFHAMLNVIVLGVLLGRDHIRRHRRLAGLVMVILVVLVFYAAHRTVVASMLATVPFLLLVARRHFIKATSIVVVSVAAFVGLVVFLNPFFGGTMELWFQRGFSGILSPLEDPTGSWRMYGWRAAMETTFSNPFWVLFGQGHGGYYYWFFNLTDDVIRTQPHNEYIHSWYKLGLVGLILYIGLLISFYKRAFHFLKQSRNELHRSVIMIFMLCILAMIVCQVGYPLTVSMWGLLGLGTALSRLWLMETPAASITRAQPPMRTSQQSESARFRLPSVPAASRRL
ncbi:MAG: O-antigen ligase family protein [Verrucomicrobia bacterium]|nr:O-antigen ligase family protein [Verrucomicrobiota bacterium]